MNRTLLITMGAVLQMACGGAYGALISADPNAMSGWKGAQPFLATDGTETLDVSVDYAVYAPGHYALSGGVDPSGGADYVYAYQVFNIVDPLSVELSALSVGIVAGSGAHHIGVDTSPGAPGQPGGVLPSDKSFSPTSARWYFASPTVNYGDNSVLLLFTSGQAPQWKAASVWDSGLSIQKQLPSPQPQLNVPEPATLALLALGGLGVIGRATRRKRGSSE